MPQSPQTLPTLALTMGDVNGIGPEVLVKALARPEISSLCRPLVFGDASVFMQACKMASLDIAMHEITNATNLATWDGEGVAVWNATYPAPEVEPAVINPLAGACAMEWVRGAVGFAIEKKVDALVTGPINKIGIHRAGYVFQGHTDFIAHLCGVESYRMCLFTDTMRIVHITGHLSLRDALDAVTRPRIVESVRIAYDSLQKLGFATPRIAVAGLNPHAGEGGAFGREEIEIIAPAVEESCTNGYPCSGPYPPDTIFKRMRDGEFDLVIAMYHDQGHVPLKLIAMDEGVNLTLGLPIIRCSVDHGTAYEIAWQNRAREESMCAALRLAARFAATQKLGNVLCA